MHGRGEDLMGGGWATLQRARYGARTFKPPSVSDVRERRCDSESVGPSTSKTRGGR